MEQLTRHIEYLLARKDCVIIPGFGAILAHSESAAFDVENGVFCPPTRSIAFNGDLTHNDGSLVCSVARAKGISYESAVIEVENAVEQMWHTLRNDGELTLGITGLFTYNPTDGTVCFKPGPIEGMGINNFWLPKLDISPLVAKTKAPATVDVETQTTPDTVKVNRFSTLRRRISSAAATLICIVSLYLLYMLVATPIVVEDAALASLAPSIITNTQHKVSTPPVQQITPSAYFVVVAKYDTEAEANEYVIHNAPYKLVIEQSGHAYYVTIGAFDTMADAEKVIAFVGERFPGAWIFKK